MFTENIKKIDLAKNLSKKLGYSVNFSKKLVDDFINSIIICIKNDELRLSNIGTFKIIKKNERMGRNPKTKKNYLIAARNSIRFIPSRKLYDINE